MKVPVKGLGVVAALAAASQAHAVPKYEQQTLPLESALFADAANKEFLTFLAGFMVLKDSSDPNLYYYQPAFKAVPQAGGAATALVNGKQIERADELDKASRDMTMIGTQRFVTLQAQYNAVNQRLINLKPEEEFQRVSLTKLRDELKSQFDALIAEAQHQENLLPTGLKEIYFDRIDDVLAQGGFPLDAGQVADAAARRKAMSQLSRSNGGVLTANIYAGLTAHQLELVHSYKEARAKLHLPEVKIAKVPVDNFTWGGLAETVNSDGSAQPVGIPMFRKIAGGGTFEGATVNLDLSVDGARAFQIAPPPMVLPIYAKARMIKKYPAFKATLDCNFKTGWHLDGRADVKDGLIIYNNDVTMNFVSESDSSVDTPCKVSFEGGGAPGAEEREAAIRKAYQAVQAQLGETFLYRSNLAMSDRREYWQHVSDDVQANRHTGANDGWSSTILGFASAGWIGGLIGIASQASNFYWHTNIQHVRHLDKLAWKQELVDDGNTPIAVDLPMNVCVAYNPSIKAYQACSDAELSFARPTSEAAETAAASPECAAAASSADCGASRTEAAPRNGNGNIAAPEEI